MSSPASERDPRITPLPAAEIRRRFVEFFEERGHTAVPSASLVPAGDNAREARKYAHGLRIVKTFSKGRAAA